MPYTLIIIKTITCTYSPNIVSSLLLCFSIIVDNIDKAAPSINCLSVTTIKHPATTQGSDKEMKYVTVSLIKPFQAIRSHQ